MTVVDAMGKPCPIPVIEARKAMKALPPEGGQVLVKVDNQIACQNLEKMAVGMGAQCSYTQTGDGAFTATITVGSHSGEAPATAPPEDGGLVVAVGSSQMGEGSEELGKVLMKSFLYAVRELDQIPGCLVFFNSGAYLTSEDSSSLADLKALEELGAHIYTCGTCMDYYGIKDKLAVGEVANMYAIASAMADAQRLIRL